MDAVLVVGYGPVGKTAALLLAQWGLKVLVLESELEPSPSGSKAICQQRDVLDIWDWVGCGQSIAEEGLTWRSARTFYRDRELFRYDFQDRGSSPFPPFVNISQSRTEEWLDQQVKAQPAITVRRGLQVSNLMNVDGGVTATYQSTQGQETIRGSFAVVCTGAHSGDLRRALSVTFEGQTFEDKFLICDIQAALPEAFQERRFYFDPPWNPGRQVLIHPCPDSTYRIDWQVPESFDLAAEQESGALDRRIRQIVGATPYRLVWSSVYKFHSRVADRLTIGRILLAGDAAHLMSPFGARGLNSGVQDAENAAWKIAYVSHGLAPEALLQTYHTERHAAALENLEVTARTMNFLAPQSYKSRRERDRILAAAGHDPKMRSLVDSGRLAEPFWYDSSPLTTPDPHRPFTGRPPRGRAPRPGPGVILPDLPLERATNTATRVRQLLRGSTNVLYTSGVDPRQVQGLPPHVNYWAMCELNGRLADLLEARENEAWVVRPDLHVAGVVPDGDSVALMEVLDRMHARVVPRPSVETVSASVPHRLARTADS